MGGKLKVAVSFPEAAAMLGVSRTTLWRLVATRKLKKATHRTVTLASIQKLAGGEA